MFRLLAILAGLVMRRASISGGGDRASRALADSVDVGHN